MRSICPEIRRRINDIIEDNELDKYRFAEAVGVSKDVINRACLYGIIPSLQSLIRIADFSDVSLDYLLAKSDDTYFDKSESGATFHDRLPALAAKHGKKYSEISHKMIFPESYFHDWLRTKTLPSLEYLYNIAEYFKVSPDYLLGRTDDDTPQTHEK